MARLIDADQFEVLSWDTTGDTSYDQGFDDGAKFVAEKIDAAPTIDAIPVEWLKKRREQLRQKEYGGLGVAAIAKVLMYWQEEKEAQDG